MNGKIVKYKVVSAVNSIVELQESVNEAINDGWEPIGGASQEAVQDQNDPRKNAFLYLQAMVKREATPE